MTPPSNIAACLLRIACSTGVKRARVNLVLATSALAAAAPAAVLPDHSVGSATERYVELIKALEAFPSSVAKLYQWLAEVLGPGAALPVVGLLWVAWKCFRWLRGRYQRRWQEWVRQLSEATQTLDPRLLADLDRALQQQGLPGALASAESALARWYGPQIWGAASFQRALLLALAYPILLLVATWLAGAEGRLGAAVVLPGATPMALRWVFALALVILAAVVWATMTGRLERSIARQRWVARLAEPMRLATATVASAASFLIFLIAVVGAGAVAVAVGLFMEHADERAQRATRQGPVLAWRAVWLLALLGLLALAAGLPVWLPALAAVRNQAFDANQPSFVLVYFIALLSVWNALCDYLSVAITRLVLREYLGALRHPGQPPAWLWSLCLALDVAAAFALTAALLLGVFAITAVLQRLGWGVDASGLLQRYESSPWWGSNAFWLVSMAVTNLLPSVAHLVALAVAKTTQRFSAGYADLPRWQAELQAGRRLASTDADRLLWFLYGARPLWALLFTALLVVLGYLMSAWLLARWVPDLARPLMAWVGTA